MKKYNEIFRNNNLEQKGLLFRINTENKTPKQVVEEILEVVRKKSGILVEKPTPIPKEQAKLTNFL